MSAAASGHDPLAAWVREHATSLSTLDPDAPLDDLEPLRELVGDARVVAVGEGAHFVHEFSLARQRVVRFLAERCGFSVLALEFGFSEGLALAPWVWGEGAEDELAQVSPYALTWGLGGLARFVRRHNTTSGHPVRFVGIDIPQAGGSLLPALAPLADYLRDVDPDVVALLETAIGIAERCAGGSGASAAPRWAALPAADQDALTATLTRLLLRMRALEPLYVSRGGQDRYDVALRQVEAAFHADYMFRAMSGLFAGTGLAGDPSVRDLYMAETVRWHLEHSAPGTRIALVAHNNHIQKTPATFGGQLVGLTMGGYLDRALGEDYRAIAVTSTDDHVPEMRLDESAAVGFTVVDTPLPAPEPGSVEAAVLGAGLGLGLVNLRRAPGELGGALDRIRTQTAYMHAPLPEAFDGVLVTPSVTVEEELGL
ncbi:erythromycin esterase family protein [Streptoalloteichus hindustanus]|uniref:Erythromycin esterase n=1 Tax=Streptoalloteichus hindustanus TaxID=2017 RepID=A0A1M5DIR4_STRHI|nr:erythromycin esterase family protein [Streptoalloteichus hindustanus]SHF66785.1 erythromycin esterase [Streptoalloteichus hindustanus]